MITTKNLSISYGEDNIIKDANLNFKDKSITAIIGPSGCGKTTLLVSLNRIIEERGGKISGEIEFMGKNINEYPLNELRKQIGMVFQKPTPFPISIEDNIKLATKYHSIKDNTVETLKRVGLYEEVKADLKKSALELSGGQQQRLSIARSLAINPRVLLLDEPCSSLDIINTKIIEDLLINLKKEMAIIIVTHNLAQARRIADETIFMLSGEVVEIGNTKDIFENPKDERTRQYIGGMFG